MIFFKRYWRGEFSLPVSYWLVSLGVNIASSMVLALFANYSKGQDTFRPLAIFSSYASLIIFIYTVWLWQTVGLWRSAGRYIETPGKTKFWGYLAMLMVILGGLRVISSFGNDVQPNLAELYRIAFSDDPDIPNYKLTIVENGHELKLTGGIKYGLVADFERALDLTPTIRTIDLESVGGRIGVAEELYNLISKRKLDTVTNDRCLSACTYVFLAGVNRYVGPGGSLGFHSAKFGSMSSPEINKQVLPLENKITRDIGVPASFFKKVWAISSEKMWNPDKEELLANRVISARISRAISSQRILENILVKDAAAFKTKLPIKVDSVTKLINVFADADKLNYIFELSSDTAQLLSAIDDLKAELRKQLVGELCSSQAVKDYMDMGVVYRHTYRDEKTKKVAATFETVSCRKS